MHRRVLTDLVSPCPRRTARYTSLISRPAPSKPCSALMQWLCVPWHGLRIPMCVPFFQVPVPFIRLSSELSCYLRHPRTNVSFSMTSERPRQENPDQAQSPHSLVTPPGCLARTSHRMAASPFLAHQTRRRRCGTLLHVPQYRPYRNRAKSGLFHGGLGLLHTEPSGRTLLDVRMVP